MACRRSKRARYKRCWRPLRVWSNIMIIKACYLAQSTTNCWTYWSICKLKGLEFARWNNSPFFCFPLAPRSAWIKKRTPKMSLATGWTFSTYFSVVQMWNYQSKCKQTNDVCLFVYWLMLVEDLDFRSSHHIQKKCQSTSRKTEDLIGLTLQQMTPSYFSVSAITASVSRNRWKYPLAASRTK